MDMTKANLLILEIIKTIEEGIGRALTGEEHLMVSKAARIGIIKGELQAREDLTELKK